MAAATARPAPAISSGFIPNTDVTPEDDLEIAEQRRASFRHRERVWCYDTAANTWTSCYDAKRARIYLGGGRERRRDSEPSVRENRQMVSEAGQMNHSDFVCTRATQKGGMTSRGSSRLNSGWNWCRA
jgi:hypothetical protein